MNSRPAILLLKELFNDRMQEGASVSNFTTSRVGGPADGLIIIKSKDELAQAVKILWKENEPFKVIGSGSNVLVSDRGYRGVIIINQAKSIQFHLDGNPPSVWAETGTNFSNLARQVGNRGYSGLEWASTIPGTLGGAVYGNAGAFGTETRDNLLMAEILHREKGILHLSTEQMLYNYRSSSLKREPGPVILSVTLQVSPAPLDEVQARMKEFMTRRKISQPAGASMGSMFKNPPGDYSGRLIEAAGLKGTSIGGAQISTKHANFFINHADATASDIKQLIDYAKKIVLEKFSINLELEIELIGEWQIDQMIL